MLGGADLFGGGVQHRHQVLFLVKTGIVYLTLIEGFAGDTRDGLAGAGIPGGIGIGGVIYDRRDHVGQIDHAQAMVYPAGSVAGGHLPPVSLFPQDGKGSTGGEHRGGPGVGIGGGLGLRKLSRGLGLNRGGQGTGFRSGRDGRLRGWCLRKGRLWCGRTRGLRFSGEGRCWSRCGRRRHNRRGGGGGCGGRCGRGNGGPQALFYRGIAGGAVDRQLQPAGQLGNAPVQGMVLIPHRYGWGGGRCRLRAGGGRRLRSGGGDGSLRGGRRGRRWRGLRLWGGAGGQTG